MKILIFGLPGSGKSTLAEPLSKLMGGIWLNADKVRKDYNDYDFSPEGRIRQAQRMRHLADGIVKGGKTVIADFVCPTEETRKIFDPDFSIWMDTIKEGRFEDTNAMFEPPIKFDYVIQDMNSDNSDKLFHKIKSKMNIFDNKKPTTMMLGRYQPFHDGHLALFKKSFDQTKQVIIMVRDIKIDDNNPFTFEQVTESINISLSKSGYTINRDYIIQLVPNITDISYGRDVGYTITKHEFDKDIHDISATKIRKQMKKDGKL